MSGHCQATQDAQDAGDATQDAQEAGDADSTSCASGPNGAVSDAGKLFAHVPWAPSN